MSEAKPDSIVKETEARGSVEDLTERLADGARARGKLPDMRAIDDFAKQITKDTIARHEEAFRGGVPDKKAPSGGSPSKLDQIRGGQAVEGGSIHKIERPFDPARLQAKRKLVPLADALEAQASANRLQLLLSRRRDEKGKLVEVFPEWAERVRTAHSKARSVALRAGLDPREADSLAADAVIKVLDSSDRAFGPWRGGPVKKIIVGA